MKTPTLLVWACFTGTVSLCNAQTAQNTSIEEQIVQEDTVKRMNLLDEQTKMYSQIFQMAGATDAESPTGGANNYLDAIDNMEGSEELKQQVREMYELYDTSLDPTRKEELKIKVENMLSEAMEKGATEN